MVSRITFAAFFALGVHCFAELDLTPENRISELEGSRSFVTGFRNGDGFVTWQSPTNWRIVGGGTRVSLIPPDSTQAEARIEITGPPQSDAFDEQFIKTFREQTLRSLAPEATNVEWAEDEVNPLLINQHPTYKVTLSYTLGGQRFTTTVWLCNFAQQQLRFRLSAHSKDFEKLQEIFRESLYTWQGLD